MGTRNKHRQIKRIHIEGEVWTYQVGIHVVSIRSPDGKRFNVSQSKICASYPTPQLVKNYIWRIKPGLMLDRPKNASHAKDMVLNLFRGAVKES